MIAGEERERQHGKDRPAAASGDLPSAGQPTVSIGKGEKWVLDAIFCQIRALSSHRGGGVRFFF